MTTILQFGWLFIQLSILALDAAAYWTRGVHAVLRVNMDDINDYTISLNSTVWLVGGEPNVWGDGEWHSVSDETLIPQSFTPLAINGSDPNLGAFEGLEMSFRITSKALALSLCEKQAMVVAFLYSMTCSSSVSHFLPVSPPLPFRSFCTLHRLPTASNRK